MKTKRKVALVGTGMVGMSFAYAALNQHLFDELVLIDKNTVRAEGEAMDLNHSLAFSDTNMNIYSGEYKDCSDADIAVICAGAPQLPGQTRLDLLKTNDAIMKSIVIPIVKSGFNGIFVVASNPVDILTQVVYKYTGFNANRVIGSGTALDTARLRYLLGAKFNVNPSNIHAYVMGEHGDSEFIPWSQAMLSTKPILDIVPKADQKVLLDNIENDVRNAAYKIIAAKHATYYGIGMSLCRIVRAILSDQHTVLTVTTYLRGEYGESDIFIGVPAVINENGVQEIVELNLREDELKKFKDSCSTLRKAAEDLK